MRKLILSMNVTLDGCLSGPHCELDWHFRSWTDDMAERLGTQLAAADTLLLGRTTYTAMARYWPARGLELACPREDLAVIEMMNRYTKVVVSGTPDLADWSNTRVLGGPLEAGIRSLKKGSGKDIILYGSGKLASALLALEVVDEYQLWLHPVALGAGTPLFGGPAQGGAFTLIQTESFRSGVVLLTYQQQAAPERRG